MTQAGAASAKALGGLRSQLLRWLLIPLLVLVAINAVSVYRNALDAADLAYARSPLASTRALAERVAIVNGKVVADVPYVAIDSFETDTLGRLYDKVTGINSEFVSGYDDLPALPPNVLRSDIYPALVRFYHATYHDEPVRIAALYQPVYDDSMRGATCRARSCSTSYGARRRWWRRPCWHGLRCEHGKVALRVLGSAQPVLEIEDAGPGIPLAERERVFAPFYRTPAAQSVNADGAGLGLAIVRDIAALHRVEIALLDGEIRLRVVMRFPIG